MARQPLGGIGRLIFRGFTITLFRHTTFGRTPLDEGPARRRDLYLTTHNTHKRQTSMPPVVFEPTILVSERPKTHALDRTATGIGSQFIYFQFFFHHLGSDTNVLTVNISVSLVSLALFIFNTCLYLFFRIFKILSDSSSRLML
jgi:hypothetical protein